MSLRDALAEKLETQIEKWDKEIDALKKDSESKKAQADNDRADAQVKGEVADKIYTFRKKIDDANQKLNEVKISTDHKLEKISKDIKGWFNE